MARPGTFKPGNKAGVGNRGPAARPKIITDVIIAKLNEIAEKGKGGKPDRAVVWKLVDELFEHAMAKTVKVGKGKNAKEVRILGDLSAMIHIFDRAEGKATQKIGTDGEDGTSLTIVFSKEDAGVL